MGAIIWITRQKTIRHSLKCPTSLASSFSKSWPLIPLRKVANRATGLLLASKICWEHRKSLHLSSSGDLAPARLSAVYMQVQGSLWAQTPKPFRAVLMVFRLWLFVFYCYEKDLHSEKRCLLMLNEKKCPRKHNKVTTKKLSCKWKIPSLTVILVHHFHCKLSSTQDLE